MGNRVLHIRRNWDARAYNFWEKREKAIFWAVPGQEFKKISRISRLLRF